MNEKNLSQLSLVGTCTGIGSLTNISHPPTRLSLVFQMTRLGTRKPTVPTEAVNVAFCKKALQTQGGALCTGEKIWGFPREVRTLGWRCSSGNGKGVGWEKRHGGTLRKEVKKWSYPCRNPPFSESNTVFFLGVGQNQVR